MRNVFSGSVMLILLVGTLTLAVNIQPVKSDYTWTQTIYIQSDGSIQPPTAPIFSLDNVTYTLTDNIAGNVPNGFSAITIQRNNITIDGAGHTLQGTNASGTTGIELWGISNVTIKNMEITAFDYGIVFISSDNNSVSGNNITANNNIGIDLDSSSYNSVSGNNITANNLVGIYLYSSSNNNSVVGNNITNSFYGMVLDSSYDNSVRGNNITANREGVWLYDSSSRNSVSGNSFVNDGLEVYGSYGNMVTGNLVNGKPLVYLEEVSGYAVGDAGQVVLVECNNVTVKNLNLFNTTTGVELWETNNTIISGNTITANNVAGIYVGNSSNNNSVIGNNITANNFEGVYLDSSSNNNSVIGNNITNSSYGIYLSGSSDNNGVSGNSITNNVAGIYLSGSSNNDSVIGNNITNNVDGIMLDSSSNGSVSGNNITANMVAGIMLYSSSNNNSVVGNNITNSSYGMVLDSSSNNTIYHDNFVNNTGQVHSYNNATNVWDNGYPSGGNYWSNYTGADLHSGPYQNETGSDGIGDTPNVIDDNNTDHYPLMQPWSFSQSTTSISISPNPGVFGSPVNCTATVSGSRLTGTATWSTSSIGGSFNQSICTLSNGTCSVTYIDNLTGCATIAASYSGDSNNMPSSNSTTLTVTSGGPVYYSQNYTSVQAAINAAPSGANVIIAPGFYTESLTINKTLTIIGEKDEPVFSAGGSGIFLTLGSGASGSTVTGIEITNFAEGILVVNASSCRIYSNIMASIGSGGIVLEGNSATGNVIFDNVFQDTPTPIDLTASAGSNTIYGNIITSQASVTLNIGANGNVVYGNIMSGSQILLNMTNSKDNVLYHNNFLATLQLTVLATGNNTWDNGYPSGGNYWSDYSAKYSGAAEIDSSGIWNMPYQVNVNNTDGYPLMKPWTVASDHCVAVISVVAAKNVIGQGFNCSLAVCAADNGEYQESFSVTAYANATVIGAQQVSGLNAACQMVLKFAWNTTGLAYGNYTVRAYAQPVAGQTDMSSTDFTLGTMKVTIPGDINGDFKVGLSDLGKLAKAYSSHGPNYHYRGEPVSPNWNPDADINSDGTVGLSDLGLLAKHYNQHYP